MSFRAGAAAAAIMAGGLLGSTDAVAQPLGVFSWQLQPFCNIVTMNVTSSGGIYTLDGYDNQCGAATRAAVAGVAFPNPDGTIGIGLTIVATPAGNPTHVDATINLATLSGTWRDSAASSGAFVVNGAAPGSPRPTHARSAPLEIPVALPTGSELTLTGIGLVPDIRGVRSGGSPMGGPAATLNGDTFLRIAGSGHDGTQFIDNRVGIDMAASENWAPGSTGTSISFRTTANGTNLQTVRMTIASNGRVGIGTLTPANLLDVNGDIRIGAGTTGCVLDSDGTVIAGTCASDARLKRDARPFAPVLDAFTLLQPVHFSWRADEFPERAFGDRRSFGLVAQEVERVLPELVTTDEDGFKAVNYSKLPLLAIQAIKELKEKNDALEARLAALEARDHGTKEPR